MTRSFLIAIAVGIGLSATAEAQVYLVSDVQPIITTPTAVNGSIEHTESSEDESSPSNHVSAEIRTDSRADNHSNTSGEPKDTQIVASAEWTGELVATSVAESRATSADVANETSTTGGATTVESGSEPTAVPSSAAGPRFVCQGMTPMWTLKIESTHMNFNQSGYAPVLYSAPGASPSQNSGAAVTNFSAVTQSGSPLSALVVHTRHSGSASCSDGHSDQAYEFSVFVNREGRIFDGCCWIER
ncbi:MAG: hypothetical protein NDI61_02875 [Bdellovibrionaceae bacterium]|nr:hypothetical protein [Pseudobdellovibrionaceae bacterium]